MDVERKFRVGFPWQVRLCLHLFASDRLSSTCRRRTCTRMGEKHACRSSNFKFWKCCCVAKAIWSLAKRFGSGSGRTTRLSSSTAASTRLSRNCARRWTIRRMSLFLSRLWRDVATGSWSKSNSPKCPPRLTESAKPWMAPSWDGKSRTTGC